MGKTDTLKGNEWFRQGVQFLSDCRNEPAVEAFTEAIGYMPDYAEAFGYRGCAFYNCGNYTAALNDYETALLLDPALYHVHFFRAVLYQGLGRHAAAVEDYTKAIEGDRYWSAAYYFRGINRGLLDDQRGALYDLVFAARLGHEAAQQFLAEKNVAWQMLSQ